MKKRLIIVRHGNTFLPEQTPTRVGRGTDLPLVEEERGRAVGKYLLSKGIEVDKVYAAPLKRTMETAQLILDELGSNLEIIEVKDFSEIDYGLDENKTEIEVVTRLGEDYVLNNNLLPSLKEEILKYGKAIISEWDSGGTVPNGWSVNVDSLIETWTSFSNKIQDGETILLCSSNGVIRFSPHILALPYQDFCLNYDIKVATGSVSIFECVDGVWSCKEWNTKAHKLF